MSLGRSNDGEAKPTTLEKGAAFVTEKLTTVFVNPAYYIFYTGLAAIMVAFFMDYRVNPLYFVGLGIAGFIALFNHVGVPDKK